MPKPSNLAMTEEQLLQLPHLEDYNNGPKVGDLYQLKYPVTVEMQLHHRFKDEDISIFRVEEDGELHVIGVKVIK